MSADTYSSIQRDLRKVKARSVRNNLKSKSITRPLRSKAKAKARAAEQLALQREEVKADLAKAESQWQQLSKTKAQLLKQEKQLLRHMDRLRLSLEQAESDAESASESERSASESDRSASATSGSDSEASGSERSASRPPGSAPAPPASARPRRPFPLSSQSREQMHTERDDDAARGMFSRWTQARPPTPPLQAEYRRGVPVRGRLPPPSRPIRW